MAANKPNILILWGDDIGYWNISHYSKGMMGYSDAQHRPHRPGRRDVHRLYGQQSCTADVACFITAQNPIRTGLTKVGMPAPTSAFRKRPTM